MAHELHRNKDGKVSFAYVGEKAWHGLGQQLTPDAPIPMWIVEAGFDWEILEADVYGKERDNANGTAGLIHMPDRKMLYRSDTKAPLSVVGTKYNVVQPPDVLKFYEDLVESGGYQLETAGILFGGKRMFGLAKVNDGAEVVKGDIVKQYLLLSTACDGTMSTTVRNTSVRVVCDNTLQMAFSGNTPLIKVPHSIQFDAKRIKQQLGLIPGSWEIFMNDMRYLANRTFKNYEAVNFLVGLFGNPTLALEDQEVKDANLMKQVYELYDGKAKGSNLSGKTAWGMLNAVTEYTDHHTGHKTDDARIDSAWFGANANLKERAYEQLMMMVS